MIQAKSAPEVNIPSEVTTFAAEQGVTEYLPQVIELTQRIYPRATLTVEIDDDPEIPNDRHILINAEGVDLPESLGLDKSWEWHGSLFACCPASLVPVFRVSVRGFR
jgi:hypothetical protein